MTHNTCAVVSVPMAPNTGSRIYTSVDPVLGEIIPAVGHEVTVRLVPVPDAGFKFILRSMTFHAERITMAAVTQVLLLRSVGSVPAQENVGVVECVIRLQSPGEAVVVTFGALALLPS